MVSTRAHRYIFINNCNRYKFKIYSSNFCVHVIYKRFRNICTVNRKASRESYGWASHVTLIIQPIVYVLEPKAACEVMDSSNSASSVV